MSKHKVAIGALEQRSDRVTNWKGGSHQPLQCSINVWERVGINVLSIPNNRIDTSNCGCFTTMQNGLPLSARHKYLPGKVLVRSVKNELTNGCKGKLERWSDIILNWGGRAPHPMSSQCFRRGKRRVNLYKASRTADVTNEIKKPSTPPSAWLEYVNIFLNAIWYE